MPAHTHTQNASVNDSDQGGISQGHPGEPTVAVTSSSTGGGGAHTIVQPYIVVYMWKRTA